MYHCPQVIIMDSHYMLFVLFWVAESGDIKRSAANVRCSIFDLSSNVTNVNAKYAFYRFLSQGIDRITAKLSPPAKIGGHTRTFQYVNGFPTFDTKDGNPPHGWQREWHGTHQAWYWSDGNEAHNVWDTSTLRGISRTANLSQLTMTQSFQQLQVSQSTTFTAPQSSASTPTGSRWDGQYYVSTQNPTYVWIGGSWVLRPSTASQSTASLSSAPTESRWDGQYHVSTQNSAYVWIGGAWVPRP
jgi:hypothetical protein